MQQQTIVRVGTIAGMLLTALTALLFFTGVRPAVWVVVAFLGGIALTIGAALEIVQKWDKFQRSPDPVWLTGIRFVFTLLGACFAPWLVIGILAVLRRLLL